MTWVYNKPGEGHQNCRHSLADELRETINRRFANDKVKEKHFNSQLAIFKEVLPSKHCNFLQSIATTIPYESNL